MSKPMAMAGLFKKIFIATYFIFFAVGGHFTIQCYSIGFADANKCCFLNSNFFLYFLKLEEIIERKRKAKP